MVPNPQEFLTDDEMYVWQMLNEVTRVVVTSWRLDSHIEELRKAVDVLQNFVIMHSFERSFNETYGPSDEHRWFR